MSLNDREQAIADLLREAAALDAIAEQARRVAEHAYVHGKDDLADVETEVSRQAIEYRERALSLAEGRTST